ncbi:MAG: MFS transporter [Lacisediminihabitans sp.]
MTTDLASASIRPRGMWAGIAVVLLALNLRPVVVSLSPLLDTISSELRLTSLTAGLLVTLPVLCFGVLGPVAPVLARRWGMERTLAGVLVAICLGSALRLHPSVPALFLGTLLVGAAIAVGNILLPGLIKRDFAHRIGLMSGLYTMSLAGGATLAAGITIPVARAAGWDWNVALAAWGLFALLAFAAWLPQLRGAPHSSRILKPATIRLSRDRMAWCVTVFLGLQSFNFYATTAWLPTIFIANGYNLLLAGWMLSLVNLVSIVPALLVPMLLVRMRNQAVFAAWLTLLYVIAFSGFVFAIDTALLWVVLLGIAQGSGLALALTLIVLRAPDADHVTALSRMAQSWGYVLAAAAPILLGAVHDFTLSWTVPLLLLLILLAPQGVAGYLAGRAVMVGKH